MYMNHLIELISKCIPGSTAIPEQVKPFIRERHLPKNDFLLQAGTVSKKISFVSKGACIKYRTKDGKEEVTEFYLEGMLTGDYVSFIKHEPAEHYIRALEDSEVEEIDYEDLQRLYSTYPLMERAGRILSEDIYCKVITRMLSYQNDSPEMRYRNLVEQRPELFQRVPQYLIASYLGVTPVGLSKIRKRLQDRLSKAD
jgi:CRP/FNR family transcriptional regulator, anaerobic regulatory protein